MDFRCVLFRPEEFRTSAALAKAAGCDSLPFKPRLLQQPQVALLLDSEEQIVWAPTLFLAEQCIRSHSSTGDTVRSYGEALVAWLRFLESRGASPSSATEELLGLFRAELAQGSESNSRNTGNHRVTVAARFHLWGERSQKLQSPLGALLLEWDGDIDRSCMGGLLGRAHRMRRPVRSAPIKRLPQALSREAIARLFAIAPMPYRLMFKWAVTVGLRRFEICNLRVSDLPESEDLALSGDGLARLHIIRKGSKDTTVHVPVRLIEETRWYTLTDRPSPAPGEEAYLFLNSRGRRISRKTLSNTFRACARSMNSTATLHHLRHTFATYVFRTLSTQERAGNDINPIKTLQVLMGHASVETTEIYLQAAETSSDAVMEALDYLYGATL